MMNTPAAASELLPQWQTAWPQALQCWSAFTQLRAPVLCLTDQQALKEGLNDSFAMIRLHDQTVVVNLEAIAKQNLGDFAVAILAHEVGHHVLAPANLNDHVRLIARIRRALPTFEHFAPLIANLYTDLLINDRLQRRNQLPMAAIYQTIRQASPAANDAIWCLYMRIYELLWGLETASLSGRRCTSAQEGDAILGVRLLRSYAYEWLAGSGRFASLFLPYLAEQQQTLLTAWFDTRHAGQGGLPSGLTIEESGEQEGALHPVEDPNINDNAPAKTTNETQRNSHGQARDPFTYGEILRASGIELSDHDIAVRYYKERALPYLIPFPGCPQPRHNEPLLEGVEPWELGDPLDQIDWLSSLQISPQVVPGLTTVQRQWGTTSQNQPRPHPLDLDLYIDSSGSIANPQSQISYLALAAAIMALSALRAGARVQVTLWSGKEQVQTTAGFCRDEQQILKVMTAFFGGMTAFPIPHLRQTYTRQCERATHIMMISDDGIATMFDTDEQGNSGWDIAATALKHARGGGSMVLNLPTDWQERDDYWGYHKVIKQASQEQDWDIYRVGQWDELVAFASAFSRKTYALERGA